MNQHRWRHLKCQPIERSIVLQASDREANGRETWQFYPCILFPYLRQFLEFQSQLIVFKDMNYESSVLLMMAGSLKRPRHLWKCGRYFSRRNVNAPENLPTLEKRDLACRCRTIYVCTTLDTMINRTRNTILLVMSTTRRGNRKHNY